MKRRKDDEPVSGILVRHVTRRGFIGLASKIAAGTTAFSVIISGDLKSGCTDSKGGENIITPATKEPPRETPSATGNFMGNVQILTDTPQDTDIVSGTAESVDVTPSTERKTDLSLWEEAVLRKFNLWDEGYSQIQKENLPKDKKGFLNLVNTLYGYSENGVLRDKNDPDILGGVILLERSNLERIESSQQADQNWLNENQYFVRVTKYQTEVIPENDPFPPETVFMWRGSDDLNYPQDQSEALKDLLVLRPSEPGGTVEISPQNIVGKNSNNETIRTLDVNTVLWERPDPNELSNANGVSFVLKEQPGIENDTSMGVYRIGESVPLPNNPQGAENLMRYYNVEQDEVLLVDATNPDNPKPIYQLVTNQNEQKVWELTPTPEVAVSEYLARMEKEWVERGFLPDDGKVHSLEMEVNGEMREFKGIRVGTTQVLADSEWINEYAVFSGISGEGESEKLQGEMPILNDEVPDARERMQILGFVPHAMHVTKQAIKELGREEAAKQGLIFIEPNNENVPEDWFTRYIKFLNTNPVPVYKISGELPNPSGTGMILTEIGEVLADTPTTVAILPERLERDYAHNMGIVGGHPEAPFGMTIMNDNDGYYKVTVEDNQGVVVTHSNFLWNGNIPTIDEGSFLNNSLYSIVLYTSTEDSLRSSRINGGARHYNVSSVIGIGLSNIVILDENKHSINHILKLGKPE